MWKDEAMKDVLAICRGLVMIGLTFAVLGTKTLGKNRKAGAGAYRYHDALYRIHYGRMMGK